MSCDITSNVRGTLLDAGLIDDKNFVIGNIGDVYSKINNVNNTVLRTYGAMYDNNNKQQNFVDTYTAPATMAHAPRVKVSFNEKYHNHIEGVKDQSNKIFEYLKPGEVIKSSEMLSRIALDKTSPMSQLANQLIPLVAKNDVDVSLQESSTMGDTIHAGLYTAENTIQISTGVRNDKASSVVIHEIIHALTVRELNNSQNIKAVRDLEKIYEDVKWLTDKKGLYGYSNVKEFAVAVLTDPYVMQDMKNMPRSGNVNVSGNNMFEQIVNRLLNMLGIKNMNDNIHKQALSAVADIMQDTSYYNQTQDVHFTNKQEEDYWNSVMSKYDDTYIDQSDFNKEEGGVQGVIDFDTPLNSPMFTGNPDAGDIVEYPSSFADWVDTRKTTLANLQRVHDYYFKLNKKDPALKDINRAIEEIEDQLANVDYEDPYLIYDNAVAEAEVLDILIDKAKNNPEQALSIIESNDLEKRVEDLNYFFLGRDKNLGDGKYNERNAKSEFYADYMKEFGQFRPKEMKEIEDNIARLKNSFNDIKKSVVVSAFTNSSFTKQHVKSGTFNQQTVSDIIAKIENGNYEVDWLGSRVLGLASGGGILGQLIKLRRDEAGDKEKAHVATKLAPMTKIWGSIKDKKDSTGKFLTDHLYQVDKFGVRLNKLASKYSDIFTTISRQVQSEQKSFNATRDARDYASWMEAEKANHERVDVRNFQSIFQKYSGDPRFKRSFEGVDMATSAKYEAKLRDKLGPVMYEIEKKKAEDLIEDFVHGYENDILTPLQKTVKDPFAFLQNFNSEDYARKDMSTGKFAEPTYTSFIPSLAEDKEAYYDKSFDTIEQNPELSEYYKGAHDLVTNYANPTFQGEGVNVGALDVQAFEDILERNSYQDLSMMGKISANAKALYINRVQRYTDGSLASMDKRLADKNHNRQKLVVAYSGDIRNRITKIKAVYASMSPEVLIKEATQKLGKTIPKGAITRVDKASGQEIRTPFFYEVAESLARQDLNKITSTNIQESLHNSAYLAADVRARRSVVAMVEAFKDVSAMANITQGDSTETKKQTNVSRMITMWAQSNIYGEKFAGDMEDKGKNFLSRVARTKIYNTKILSGTDRLTIKKVEELMKFSSANGVKDFVFNEKKYAVNKLTKEITEDGKAITIEEFKKVYKEMLTKDIGTQATVGSLLLGYMDNLRAVQLGLSPRAGIKNRIAGMSQSMSVAASGKFGFDLNDYHASRRFLRGVNTRQYVSKLGKWAVNENNPKYVQVHMLEQLVSNLELEQNRADEMANEAKFGSKAGSQKIESLKNFLMDFAMNNPEKHNQLELAVSIMMTTSIEDKDGKRVNFFDNNKLEFTPYKPGTLVLKDEFRTPKNEAMWEQFKSYKDPVTGEESSDSVAMTARIKSTVEQTQGNYNNDDIVMIQNSVAGKLGTMYTRYMYENTNLQFGKHSIDLRTGELDMKGRKINLAEHAPTTMVYLGSNFVVPIIASSLAFAALSPWIAATAGVGAAVTLGLMIKTKSLNAQSATSMKEWKLAKDFALETLLLMGKTPLNTFSYGSINPKIIDQAREKLTDKNYGGMITQKDRLALSECAQEVATKFTNYAMYTLSALVAKFLFTALVGGDDDKDDNAVQRKIKDLVNIENVVNALLNDRDQVLSDINRYLSPQQFYNDATAFSFARSLARDGMVSYNIVNGDYADKPTDKLVTDISKLNFIPGVNMIPNNAKKAVIGMFSADKGVFSDDRVYNGKDAIDKTISKNMKKGEDYYKAESMDQRKDISRDAKDYYAKQIDAEDQNLSRTERKDEISRRVKHFLQGVTKSKDETYQELIESGNFKDKREEMDAMMKE